MKLTKKHALLISVLAVMMALCTIAGATLAYLFVKTDPVVNTFSPSNIELTLIENTGNTYQMIPGTVYAKDPKVTVTADLNCYVFVKVEKSTGFDTYMTCSVNVGDTAWKLVPGQTNVYYRLVTAAEASDGESFYVLTGNSTYPNGIVTINNSVTKDVLKTLTSNPTLTFTAYAIQQDGFASAEAAWPYALAQSNSIS